MGCESEITDILVAVAVLNAHGYLRCTTWRADYRDGRRVAVDAQGVGLDESVAIDAARAFADLPGTTGAEMIAAERRRQIHLLGYPADGSGHEIRDFAVMAAVYLESTLGFQPGPFADSELMCVYKPKGQLRDLVRAGALIAAAIDRRIAAEGGGE